MKEIKKYFKKQIIFYIVIISLLFVGCASQSHNSDNLASWVGNFEFSEYVSPNINMQYEINIYKENNHYKAIINVDGFQSLIRVDANILNDKNSIYLVFDSYLPENQHDLFAKGDVILSFRKEGLNILTKWGVLEPILPENKETGIYFMKTK